MRDQGLDDRGMEGAHGIRQEVPLVAVVSPIPVCSAGNASRVGVLALRDGLLTAAIAGVVSVFFYDESFLASLAEPLSVQP
jgi:hypothetical protein